mmetsp:Transcript_10508/g.36288  ORF Transcript_10508/g.36288 Transcript_10508/m.36288 type:complete len:203 (+) Transcript_10508:186-794(+)
MTGPCGLGFGRTIRTLRRRNENPHNIPPLRSTPALHCPCTCTARPAPCSVLGQSTPPVRATLLRTFAVFLQLSRCVRPCVTLEGNSPKPSRPRPGATSTVLPAPTERQLSIQDLENARSSFGCSNHDSPHCTCEDLPQQSSRASQLFLGPPRLATRADRARKHERIGRGGRKKTERRGGGGRRCPRCPALRALRHRTSSAPS